MLLADVGISDKKPNSSRGPDCFGLRAQTDEPPAEQDGKSPLGLDATPLIKSALTSIPAPSSITRDAEGVRHER